MRYSLQEHETISYSYIRTWRMDKIVQLMHDIINVVDNNIITKIIIYHNFIHRVTLMTFSFISLLKLYISIE